MLNIERILKRTIDLKLSDEVILEIRNFVSYIKKSKIESYFTDNQIVRMLNEEVDILKEVKMIEKMYE